MPLDITNKDIQLAHLFESDEDIDLGVFDKDFIPKQIDDEYHFPVKTVYSGCKDKAGYRSSCSVWKFQYPFYLLQTKK